MYTHTQRYLPLFVPTLWEFCSTHNLPYLNVYALSNALSNVVSRRSYDFSPAACRCAASMSHDQANAFIGWFTSNLLEHQVKNVTAWFEIMQREA